VLETTEVTDYQYWDQVGNDSLKVKESGAVVIRDNWWKRVKLMNYMTQYDLYGTHILEIGTGRAIMAVALKILNGNFYYRGTELGESYIDYCKQAYGLNIQNAKANNLPYKDNEFDTLFMFDVLEHIHPDERLKSYEEIKRVLKDNFTVFINHPHMNNKSLHDNKYDHYYGLNEMFEFADILGADIKRIESYELDVHSYRPDGTDLKNEYYFIVLGK
jgi:ubiquinone/menaquinone biosynthesis C-methylase UbiE